MAKCPICGKNKSSKKDLLQHVEMTHKNEIPSDMSCAQYVYYLNHGRKYGICRICGNPTPWNEKAGKPKQICGSEECKRKVSKEFEQNLKAKYNKTRQDLMNDPDHQEEMLANRKISGVYKWSDNKHLFTYTGSYEKFALEWLDKVMDIDPDTVQTPGPKIQYMFEGKPHYWITDMYLSDFNLVIEVKDGNGTGEKNNHPGFAHNRDLEKAKDDYMKTQNQYNYIKLTNKNMMQLIKILSKIRLNNIFDIENDKKNEPIIDINENIEFDTNLIPLESLNESIMLEKITGQLKDLHLRIVELTKDILRKWYNVKEINVSKKEKQSLLNIIKLSEKLINYISEILQKGIPVSYETTYEEFLNEIKNFKKYRKNDDEKNEKIKINILQNHLSLIQKKFKESSRIDSDIKFNKKYKTALYIVMSRTLYVLNLTLYNLPGKGSGGSFRSDKRNGIVSKRYGNRDLKFNMKKMSNNENLDLLDKLRNSTDYGSYKKLFDYICNMYKKENDLKNICKSIASNLSKIININTINESYDQYDIIDVSKEVLNESYTDIYYDISNQEIDALCEGNYYYQKNEIDLLNEVSFPFFSSINKKNDKSKSVFSTYDIKTSTWKNLLFPKSDFVKKVTSIFHKVEINTNNHTIEIRGINYRKLIQHIKDLYPDQKVYKIFEIIYNAKDWDKYSNKKIKKSDVRIEYIETYEFFALELSILFKELYNKYNLSPYNDICTEIYNKTWLSHSDIIQPEQLDMSKLRLLNTDYELKPFQKDFIELYPTLKSKLNLNGYILSFDQGLGKTLTSIALALCLKKEKVYVVCPNALKENWALEIKSYFPKYSNNDEIWKEEVYVNGISKNYDSKKVKFIIVNQESIPKIYDKVDLKSNNILIIDESHNFRNLDSQRSNNLIELKNRLKTNDILIMSGTPIKASPNEICPVLKLIDPLFTDKVANIYNKCFNMNSMVASNLIQTRFGKIMYRKTKDEVLQLPEKHIEVLKFKVKNEDRYYVDNIKSLVKDRAKEIFKKEYKDYDSLKEEFHDIINKYSTSSKEDIKKYLKIIDENRPNYEMHEMDVLFKKEYLNNYVYPSISNKDKERLDYLLVRFVNMWQHCMGIALGEILHPRRKELFMKLYDDNKVVINNMIFDNIKKTVIFTPIVDVAKYIHKSLEDAGLSSVLVTGETKDKLTPILRFKEDSNVDVLVATSQTLGTGVTLTEANLMFFFGTPWRSADFDQCCDRIYRMGQTSDVFIFNVLMDSKKLNLSTRMENILNWSNEMFDSFIGSTNNESIDIESLNEINSDEFDKNYDSMSYGELKLLADRYKYYKDTGIIRPNKEQYDRLLKACERRGIRPDGSQYWPYTKRKKYKNKNKKLDESVMSISNLSPILTTGLFEELQSNKNDKDFDKQLEFLKKSLSESLSSYDENDNINQFDYCPEKIDTNNLSTNKDKFLMNRVKTDIVNKTAITVTVNKHYGDLYVSSDFHVFGVWNKNDNNKNATNIQQVNAIIDDINSKVKDNDTLILCGDVGYKLDDCLLPHTKYFLQSIKCKHIWLVLGNHDLLTNDQYKEFGCEIVCDRLEYNGWVFTHYPINTNKFNFYAHLHDEKLIEKTDDYKNMSTNNRYNCFYYTNGITNVKNVIEKYLNNNPDMISNSLNEEAIYNSIYKYPIFIILMHTGTLLADAIKKFTHDDYSHASISLTPDLVPMYSFGRKKVDIKEGSGFCINSPNDDFFRKFKSVYAVYVMYLSKNEYDNIKKRLQYFIDNKDTLKYDMLALIMNAMNKPTENSKKYFCSRFVADVLNSGRSMDKLPSLYRPNDFVYRSDITLVNSGIDISKYNKNITLKNLKLIQKGLYNNINLTETSLKDSDVMFGNGEYTAITDNRFTDFQTGNPFEQNEDIDPYTAIFSPNNDKPVQDYIDSSNNFETNEEVRIDMEVDPSNNGSNDLSNIAQSIYNSNFD